MFSVILIKKCSKFCVCVQIKQHTWCNLTSKYFSNFSVSVCRKQEVFGCFSLLPFSWPVLMVNFFCKCIIVSLSFSTLNNNGHEQQGFPLVVIKILFLLSFQVLETSYTCVCVRARVFFVYPVMQSWCDGLHDMSATVSDKRGTCSRWVASLCCISDHHPLAA